MRTGSGRSPGWVGILAGSLHAWVILRKLLNSAAYPRLSHQKNGNSIYYLMRLFGGLNEITMASIMPGL